MRSRSGVSLIEVLVAAVLLAVGICGTLAALAATARLRQLARDREALAAAALDRLAWFEARACAHADTAERATLSASDSVTVQWRVTDSLGRRAMRFEATSAGRAPQRLTLTTSWRCG